MGAGDLVEQNSTQTSHGDIAVSACPVYNGILAVFTGRGLMQTGHSGHCPRLTFSCVSVGVGARKGGCPTSISKRITPTLHQSHSCVYPARQSRLSLGPGAGAGFKGPGHTDFLLVEEDGSTEAALGRCNRSPSPLPEPGRGPRLDLWGSPAEDNQDRKAAGPIHLGFSSGLPVSA